MTPKIRGSERIIGSPTSSRTGFNLELYFLPPISISFHGTESAGSLWNSDDRVSKGRIHFRISFSSLNLGLANLQQTKLHILLG